MTRVAHLLLVAIIAAGSVGAAAQTPPESSAHAAERAPQLQSTAAVLWR